MSTAARSPSVTPPARRARARSWPRPTTAARGVARSAAPDVTSLRADYAPDGQEHAGEFPYTRGISAEPGPWIMGQYAGFGTAAETNGRVRALLDAGGTGVF